MTLKFKKLILVYVVRIILLYIISKYITVKYLHEPFPSVFIVGLGWALCFQLLMTKPFTKENNIYISLGIFVSILVFFGLL